jgi:2-amino-4-hydroxy-6-hydroxymethyldihydropteridine diphosphokinase
VTRVYILLGSNLNAEENLRRAVALLSESVDVTAVSHVYESAPVGDSDQPCFLNAAVSIEATLLPGRLRNDVLRPLEARMGRVRTQNKYGPRTIDLDIVLYGERILVCGDRRIPDPGLLRHAYVACPMAELAPTLVHPESGETLEMIARRVGCYSIRPRPDVQIGPTSIGTEGNR